MLPTQNTIGSYRSWFTIFVDQCFFSQVYIECEICWFDLNCSIDIFELSFMKTFDLLIFQVNILDLESKEVLFSIKPENDKSLGKQHCL